MPALSHLFRRGAVHWWRRRLPCPCGGSRPGSVQLSLGVRELGTARRLATHLTARSEIVFAKVRSGMLTQQQSNTILQGELQRLREKFASHNAHDLLENIRREEARIDRIVAEVYALVAARDLQFELSDADRVRLQAKGLTIDVTCSPFCPRL